MDFPKIDPVGLKRDVDAFRKPPRRTKIESLMMHAQRSRRTISKSHRPGEMVDTSEPELRSLMARGTKNKLSSNSMAAFVQRPFEHSIKRRCHPRDGTNFARPPGDDDNYGARFDAGDDDGSGPPVLRDEYDYYCKTIRHSLLQSSASNPFLVYR